MSFLLTSIIINIKVSAFLDFFFSNISLGIVIFFIEKDFRMFVKNLFRSRDPRLSFSHTTSIFIYVAAGDKTCL